MKICDIVQFYSPLGGGVKRYLEDKIDYFAQQSGCNHMVIIPSEKDAVYSEGHTTFYEIKSFPLIGSLSYRMLLNRKRILSIIERERPDILEVGDPYRSAWIALEAAKRYNIPVVAFYHSDFPRALGRTISRFCGKSIENILSGWINNYVSDLYNRMNATVVASRRMENVLNRCGIERVVRIPLGTNVQVFQPNPEANQVRKELDLKSEDTLLLFVGRLAREKNIHALIHMMDQLPVTNNKGKKYHLLLVGDGELRAKTQKWVKTRSDVTLYQYCKLTEHLTAYYTAADVFIHAGCYETFGITSLEAQACGTRVLAVQGGGLDDSVEGESPLIMAKSPDPFNLADGIRRIENLKTSQTPEQRRQRIVENFSIQLTLERLTKLYEYILKGHPVEDFFVSSNQENQNELHYQAILTG